jgi:serine/threonine protein phosphatase 1
MVGWPMEDLTFAIGDVHGCVDKLQALLAACERVRGGRDARVVLVGDYIDRGPQSRDVVDFLIHRQRGEGSRLVCLRGNHEQMLLDAAASGRTVPDLLDWLSNGGEHTLLSYGVHDPVLLPGAHLEWISSLPLQFSDSQRHFVHAGIRPGVALADQTAEDLLWIREPFLSSEARHPGFIVHGHTPTRSGLPDLRAHRLNLDTGACFGGELTAAAFTDAAAPPFLFINHLGETWQP